MDLSCLQIWLIPKLRYNAAVKQLKQQFSVQRLEQFSSGNHFMTPLKLRALYGAPAASLFGTTSHGLGGAVGGKDRDLI